MKWTRFVILVVLILAVSSALAFAQCGGGEKSDADAAKETETLAASKAETGEGEVINTVCPVMGAKIDKDTPYVVEYEGKKIGFCCAACIDKFNANPEEYLSKLEQEETKE